MSNAREKFGMFDQDLKTPKHDEIILWLHSNIDTILRDWLMPGFELGSTWDTEALEKVLDKSRKSGLLLDEETVKPPSPGIVVRKLEWEYPVKRRDYIAGFVDLMVSGSTCRSVTLITKGGTTYWTGCNEFLVHFEVKSSPQNLGEVIRQIAYYREFSPGLYAVVAPGTWNVEVLKSQKIHFISYGEVAK